MNSAESILIIDDPLSIIFDMLEFKDFKSVRTVSKQFFKLFQQRSVKYSRLQYSWLSHNIKLNREQIEDSSLQLMRLSGDEEINLREARLSLYKELTPLDITNKILEKY